MDWINSSYNVVTGRISEVANELISESKTEIDGVRLESSELRLANAKEVNEKKCTDFEKQISQLKEKLYNERGEPEGESTSNVSKTSYQSGGVDDPEGVSSMKSLHKMEEKNKEIKKLKTEVKKWYDIAKKKPEYNPEEVENFKSSILDLQSKLGAADDKRREEVYVLQEQMESRIHGLKLELKEAQSQIKKLENQESNGWDDMEFNQMSKEDKICQCEFELDDKPNNRMLRSTPSRSFIDQQSESLYSRAVNRHGDSFASLDDDEIEDHSSSVLSVQTRQLDDLVRRLQNDLSTCVSAIGESDKETDANNQEQTIQWSEVNARLTDWRETLRKRSNKRLFLAKKGQVNTAIQTTEERIQKTPELPQPDLLRGIEAIATALSLPPSYIRTLTSTHPIPAQLHQLHLLLVERLAKSDRRQSPALSLNTSRGSLEQDREHCISMHLQEILRLMQDYQMDETLADPFGDLCLELNSQGFDGRAYFDSQTDVDEENEENDQNAGQNLQSQMQRIADQLEFTKTLLLEKEKEKVTIENQFKETTQQLFLTNQLVEKLKIEIAESQQIAKRGESELRELVIQKDEVIMELEDTMSKIQETIDEKERVRLTNEMEIKTLTQEIALLKEGGDKSQTNKEKNVCAEEDHLSQQNSQSQLKQITDKLNFTKTLLHQKEQEKVSIENQFKETTQQLFHTNKLVDKLKKEVNESQEQAQRRKLESEEMEAHRDATLMELDQTMNVLMCTQDQVSMLKVNIEEKELIIMENAAQIKSLSQEVDSLKHTTNAHNLIIEESETKIISESEDTSRLKLEITSMSSMLAEKNDELISTSVKLHDLATNVEAKESELFELKSQEFELQSVRERAEDLDRELAQCKLELTDSRESNNLLKKRLDNMQEKQKAEISETIADPELVSLNQASRFSTNQSSQSEAIVEKYRKELTEKDLALRALNEKKVALQAKVSELLNTQNSISLELNKKIDSLTVKARELEQERDQLAGNLDRTSNEFQSLLVSLDDERLAKEQLMQEFNRLRDDYQLKFATAGQLDTPQQTELDNIRADRDRLQQHLLNIENEFSKDAVLKENRETDLLQNLRDAESKLEKLNALKVQYESTVLNSTKEKDALTAKNTALATELAQLQSSMENLQSALDMEQVMRQHAVDEQMASHRSKLKIAEERLAGTQQQLQSATKQAEERLQAVVAEQESKADQRLNRLMAQLRVRDETISDLMQQLSAQSMERTSSIEKGLMRNLLIGYLRLATDKRPDALRMITQLLDFTDADRAQLPASETTPGGQGMTGWLRQSASVLLTTPPQAERCKAEAGDKPFIEYLYNYLDKESTPAHPLRMPAEYYESHLANRRSSLQIESVSGPSSDPKLKAALNSKDGNSEESNTPASPPLVIPNMNPTHIKSTSSLTQ